MPDWWFNKLESAPEFGLIALFFVVLDSLARKHNTDGYYLPKLKLCTWVEGVLFVTFFVLVYVWVGYYIAYGALYILSLSLAFGVTIRMRKTVEALPQT